MCTLSQNGSGEGLYEKWFISGSWPVIGPANNHNTPSIITQHRQTDRERQIEREREREGNSRHLLDWICQKPAGGSSWCWACPPGVWPQSGATAGGRRHKTERGNKPRNLRALHPLGLERKCEAVVAGLEHPHLSKKACVTASAQCVP